ncbi:hypothetical protein [Stenotrophomonas sp. SY1]|uniref:hypothetical protein n=1 Tax=Stenotrophomonas sp. SY1 TaxID=477235 RepID=UPI001E33C079|nr:hypothetical protein [Stenotrophomonas sp. SY1]MCD9088742.1 hypothetical protein [Stenotrophomonas sp. SY1]
MINMKWEHVERWVNADPSNLAELPTDDGGQVGGVFLRSALGCPPLSAKGQERADKNAEQAYQCRADLLQELPSGGAAA